MIGIVIELWFPSRTNGPLLANFAGQFARLGNSRSDDLRFIQAELMHKNSSIQQPDRQTSDEDKAAKKE